MLQMELNISKWDGIMKLSNVWTKLCQLTQKMSKVWWLEVPCMPIVAHSKKL